MVNRGSQAAAEAMTAVSEDSALIPTSIRLHPRVRAYYEAQAEAVGAPSSSAMMAMVLEGVMKATRPPEVVSSSEAMRESVDLVKDRFLHLFRVHGFTPYMIADVLQPHGIGLAELKDEAKLLSLLSDQVLAEQAERFNVQPEWLAGKPVTPVSDPYHRQIGKSPNWLCKSIADRLRDNPGTSSSLKVLFVRESGESFQAAFESDSNQGAYVGVVVRETRRTPAGKEYHRYEAWRTVPWAYGETRLSIKVILFWLQRLKRVSSYQVGFEGLELNRKALIGICDYGELPAEALEGRDRLNPLKHWDPEDYIEDTSVNMVAKEVSERQMALDYYGHNKMEDCFAGLPYVRSIESRPIDYTEEMQVLKFCKN